MLKENLLLKFVNFLIYSLSIIQVARRTIFSDGFEINYWSYSELLIFYPGTFIRRGLLGQIIQIIDDDGILLDSTLLIIFVNYCVFITLLFLNFRVFKLSNHQSFLFLMSTFGIFQISIYNQYFHRKEMFLITIFLFINLLLKNNLNNLLKFIFVISLTAISILIHEGIALLMFPFVYYLVGKKSNRYNFQKIYLILSSMLFLIVIFNSGSLEISEQIRNSLTFDDRILFETVRDNQGAIVLERNRDAITTIGWSLLDTFTETTLSLIFSGSMFLWVFFLVLFVVSIFVILNFSLHDILKYDLIDFLRKNKIFLLIIPIFIVGFDWGRWIFSIFYFLFFTLINLKTFEPIKRFKLNEVLFLFVSFFTIMPECCLEMTKGDRITKNLLRIFESVIFHLS